MYQVNTIPMTLNSELNEFLRRTCVQANKQIKRSSHTTRSLQAQWTAKNNWLRYDYETQSISLTNILRCRLQ